MSFISPLEELAEKFNILNFNIRELLHKLSIWGETDSDGVNIRIKTPNEPYFENYTIPSKKYLDSNKVVNSWNKFTPNGTKFWGISITDPGLITTSGGETFHNIFIDSATMARTNIFDYEGEGIEGDVRVTLDSTGVISSQIEFIVNINKVSANSTGENFIYFIDSNTSTILAKIGKSDLVTALGGVVDSNSDIFPKTFKLVFQLVRNPIDSENKWVVLDMYQFPRYAYFSGSNVAKPL